MAVDYLLSEDFEESLCEHEERFVLLDALAHFLLERVGL